MDELLLLQLPPAVILFNEIQDPPQILVVPVIAAGYGLTVTLNTLEQPEKIV
jgi:hypothetical protein